MKETVNERFVQLIKALRLNTNSFAKSIDKAYTSVEAICKGKTKPSYDLLEAIFMTYSEVSRDWLLMGEGNMFLPKQVESLKVDNYLQNHLKTLEENFDRLAAQLETKDQQLETKDHQIANLTEMLKMVLGKPKGVPSRPNRTLNLQQSGNHGVYALPGRPN